MNGYRLACVKHLQKRFFAFLEENLNAEKSYKCASAYQTMRTNDMTILSFTSLSSILYSPIRHVRLRRCL